MDIGSILKARRLEKGMTQTALAKQVGYKDKRSIVFAEQNRIDFPLSRFLRICEVLELDPADVIRAALNKVFGKEKR